MRRLTPKQREARVRAIPPIRHLRIERAIVRIVGKPISVARVRFIERPAGRRVA